MSSFFRYELGVAITVADILQKNYRQQTDPQFQNLLDEIREGILTEESINTLKSRIDAELDMSDGLQPTYLLPLIPQVQEENRKAIENIKGEVMKFTWSKVEHNVDRKTADRLMAKLLSTLQAEEEIILKIGLPVILLVNLSVEDGLVNGLQGVVESFDEEDGFPVVKFLNGRTLKVIQYRWNESLRKSNRFEGVSILQIPIKPAAALTVHKAQSITLNKVKLNLGPRTFAGGQAYTALSRCRTLKGLSLTDFHIRAIQVNPKAIAFYKQYSALKSRLIEEDGEEDGASKRLILELLTKHIPSALSSSTPPRKKRQRMNFRRGDERKTSRATASLDVLLDDAPEKCPF